MLNQESNDQQIKFSHKWGVEQSTDFNGMVTNTISMYDESNLLVARLEADFLNMSVFNHAGRMLEMIDADGRFKDWINPLHLFEPSSYNLPNKYLNLLDTYAQPNISHLTMLRSLYVRPEYRGFGIMKMLLVALSTRPLAQAVIFVPKKPLRFQNMPSEWLEHMDFYQDCMKAKPTTIKQQLDIFNHVGASVFKCGLNPNTPDSYLCMFNYFTLN